MKKTLIPAIIASVAIACDGENFSKPAEISPEATDGKISMVDIVNCDDKIELMVNYEARELWNTNALASQRSDEKAALDFYLERLNAVDPYLGSALQKRVADPDFSFSFKRGIEHDRPYSIPFDPILPVNCKPRVLAKEIERNIEEDPRFIVDLDYWDRLSVDSRALATLNLAILDEGLQKLNKDYWQVYSRYLTAMAASDSDDSMTKGLLNSPAGRQIRFVLNRANFYSEPTESGGTKLTSKIDQIFNSNNIRISLKREDTITIGRDYQFTIKSTSRDFAIDKTVGAFQSFTMQFNDLGSNVASEFTQSAEGFILIVNGIRPTLSFKRLNQHYYEDIQYIDRFEFWPNMIPKSMINFRRSVTMPISSDSLESIKAYDVSFHPNGAIKAAELSTSQTIQGQPFAAGAKVNFDQNGTLMN